MRFAEMNSQYINDIYVFCDAKQGGRAYMEDILSVHSHRPDVCNRQNEGSKSYRFFAVYDGHGGIEAADFAEQHLENEIVRQPGFWSDSSEEVVQAIKGGFISTHKLMQKAIGYYYLLCNAYCPTDYLCYLFNWLSAICSVLLITAPTASAPRRRASYTIVHCPIMYSPSI